MKKVSVAATAALLISSLSFSSAFAFTDVSGTQLTAVSDLQQRGIVSGIDKDHFAPMGTITYAQSVQMIVKAFNYNLDLNRLAKPPVASELYTNVQNDSWYADAFIAAHFNGIDIPKDVNPNAAVTREQFAALLMPIVEKKANLPMINLVVELKDSDQIQPELQGKVLRLLHYKIAELDKDSTFKPKAALTRGEAATWMYNSLQFVSSHSQHPVAVDEVTVGVEKINENVNKVTLFRGQKPNAGYGIKINSIRFEQDGRAVISYTQIDPQPDQMYPEVVTDVKAETYLPSSYTPEIELVR
ncbi:protease complex subunit PrcB family protein [Paenibacillus sp. H1-7]|uniref:S-layer homology domain-containing protein n=1 Tax=Paenibacillus sp. H1-7 TaxID=2282849 RepID=UPI001EF7A676|nr:S-layer homology domain-containing protein [Paenibacillus sp. H1-7]ULL16300.1 protease complex subunit PrcB family protein [Paenibacillus sp. H1-7]